MARVRMIGMELGDASELSTTFATGYSADSAQNTGYGNYALKCATTTAAYQQIITGLSTTRARAKVYFRLDSVTVPGAGYDMLSLARFFDNAVGFQGQINWYIDQVPANQQIFVGSSTGVNTAFACSLNANQWYRLEIDFQKGAGTGQVQVYLDGVQIITVASQQFGANNTDIVQVGWDSAGNNAINAWIDDIEYDDAVLPGGSYIVARQFDAGTPTYDAWTKNGGATISDVWNDTPFSTATSASSFTSVAAQTGLIYSFSLTQTGHGNGVVDPFDTINGVKVSLIAKTAATTAAGITQVGASQVSSVLSGADITLTFNVAPIAGDVVYVWGGHVTRASTNIGPSTAGYDPINVDTTTNTQSFGLWRKVMGATPDTTVVCQGTGNAADSTAYQSIVLRQADTSSPEDATTIKASNTTGAPNPGAIISVTASAWILAVAGSQNSDATVGTQASYTQNGAANSNDTNPMTIAGSFLTTPGAAGSYDPPAWGSWANGQWIAFTVAVRPALAAGSAASIRRRLAGVDTDTAITLTTSDVCYQTTPFTATLADINDGQAGVLHGSNSFTQTVEDAWVNVSFTPVQGLMGQAVL